MTTEQQVQELELELLLAALARHYGHDFRDYSRPSLVRRLRQALADEGLSTLSALQERVLRDTRCLQRVLAVLSVGATAMFRDPGFFSAFRTEAIPLLRTYPFVRIWHAGCSTGEEVYSMAIALHEAGLYERCRLYATDMSDTALKRARRGIFPLSTMQQYTRNYQLSGGVREFSDYYVADHEYATFAPHLKKNMIFGAHNLASDWSFNEFNLVLCRNVMLYFNVSLRDRVHRMIYASLCRFGLLALGSSESLRWTPMQAMYKELPSGVRLYQRLA